MKPKSFALALNWRSCYSIYQLKATKHVVKET